MSIILGKLSIFLSRLMGHRGSDVGGRTAIKHDKNLFKKLASNIDTIILVSGTNGKSSVTNLIASVLEQDSDLVIANKTGANLYTGLLSSMIEATNLSGNKKFKYAVFEVDEATLPNVMNELDHAYVVFTNFFKDQLDRYNTTDLLIEKIKKGFTNDNVKLILNADDSNNLKFEEYSHVCYGLGKEVTNFVDNPLLDALQCHKCGNLLEYTHHFYQHLGYYQCQCGFKREEPKYKLTSLKSRDVIINDKNIEHNLLGDYNAYNVLAAYALLKELNFTDETIQEGFSLYNSKDGRMQLFNIKGKRVYLNLVKNTAGMNMTLKEIKGLNVKHVVFILNDAVGDGKDVSWIWDVDIESLNELDIECFYVCGSRGNDMSIRLKNAGIERQLIIAGRNFTNLVDSIIKEDSIVLASYTALNEAKKILLQKEKK